MSLVYIDTAIHRFECGVCNYIFVVCCVVVPAAIGGKPVPIEATKLNPQRPCSECGV